MKWCRLLDNHNFVPFSENHIVRNGEDAIPSWLIQCTKCGELRTPLFRCAEWAMPNTQTEKSNA